MAASKVLMIKPANFGYNSETAATNYFQHQSNISAQTLEAQVQLEFDEMVNTLIAAGIEVMVIADTDNPIKPDAIFPNNWFSSHPNGDLIIYPMCHKNRQLEKREDIISLLKNTHSNFISLAYLEALGEFLEGTGSLIIDENSRTGFASISPRTSLLALEKFGEITGYKIIAFNATDADKNPIYHTNVMMALTDKLAIICLDSIAENEQQIMQQALFERHKIIVDFSLLQMQHFVGNMLHLSNKNGESILVLSTAAYNVLTETQATTLKKHHRLLPISIPTIESIGGGSVRCMMAELYF
jgi:hypothetical protein